MKKLTAALLGMLLCVFLTACKAEPPASSLYIEPAKLTAEEEALKKLLGDSENILLLDALLDDSVKSCTISKYELENGAWKNIEESSYALLSRESRIAISAGDLGNGSMRVAIQDGEDSYSSIQHHAPETEKEEGLGIATSVLAEREPVTFGEEIPLMIQIQTAKTEISSYLVEYFFQPERYAEHDYEHVYALTITFLQSPLS